MQTPSRTELPLTTSGSGCSCCSTGTSQTPGKNAAGVEYGLEGLTCAGCVASVERAVTAVDGVEAATIELVPGGVSRLSITGAAEPSAVGDAVTSAGYSLSSS